MERSESKKKPAEHFSILIIPRNHSGVRRIELSGGALKFMAGATVFAAVAVFGVFVAMFSYRSAFNATEDVRMASAEFMRERAELQGKVRDLEGTLARTGRFVSKIESALDARADGFAGLGPVEESAIPTLENKSAASKPFRLGLNRWEVPLSEPFVASFNTSIDELSKISNEVEKRVHSVFMKKQDKSFFWASLPSLWPTKGWVTSEFGDRRGRRRGFGRFHEGIDIAGPRGTPIVAPGNGVVTYIGYKGGYGNTMVIDHGYGISTLYGHCAQIYVNEGQVIKRGMIIAAVGNTGRSTGPHLHYEVHLDGAPIDPMLYIMNSL